MKIMVAMNVRAMKEVTIPNMIRKLRGAEERKPLRLLVLFIWRRVKFDIYFPSSEVVLLDVFHTIRLFVATQLLTKNFLKMGREANFRVRLKVVVS